MTPHPEFTRLVKARGRTFLLQVETSNESADYAKYERVRNEIWGFAEDNLPSDRNLMCENFLHEGSSLLIAVYDLAGRGARGSGEGALAGFSYGFVGLRDKSLGFRSTDNLWFYSQYTGVKDEYRSFGLGVRIKEFQGDILRGVFGVTVVTCTYDPLTAVNAHRNIRRLGMEVQEYRVATYGEYGGFLNRQDVPSDRFFMLWDLKKPYPRPAGGAAAPVSPEGCVLDVVRETVRGASGPVEIEIVRRARRLPEGETVCVPIPADFYRMLRETDVEDEGVRRIALEWRMLTREVFRDLFSRGYAVRDFQGGGRLGSGFYILRKRA